MISAIPLVVVAGSINVDYVVVAERLPGKGETVIGRSFQRFPGGKGANQAVGMARLGTPVFHIGKVGADENGTFMRQRLAEAGVSLSGVTEELGSGTGLALIQIAEDGNNTIIVVPGANHRLMPGDLNRFDREFSDAGVLVLQNEIPHETNLAACGKARQAGSKIVYNPAPFQPGSEEICLLADYVILNEIELSGLVRHALSDTADLIDAGKACHSRFQNKALIITLGEQGSLMIDSSGVLSQPARPVKAVDTTAAGDAFISGFVSSLACRHTLEECIRLATDVSAYAVTVMGAQPSLPTRRQLESFLAGGSQDGT
jgi:ribokinase